MNLHLIVSCTNKKTREASPEATMRAYSHLRIAGRHQEWVRVLEQASEGSLPARQLYCGDHWAVVRSLEKRVIDLTVWISSAGYGLIQPDSKIIPYSATFVADQPDSVSNGLAQPNAVCTSRWWKLLAGWTGSGIRTPRTVTELAHLHPRTVVLVVASRPYLEAMYDDLLSAREELTATDQLLLLSAGTRELGALSDHLLPCDARLQPLVGGALASLNVRVARYLISHWQENESSPLRLSPMRGVLKSVLARQQRHEPPRREVVSDEEVREFIRRAFLEPVNGYTPLLRALRDSGRACEFTRFRSLFTEVKASVYETK